MSINAIDAELDHRRQVLGGFSALVVGAIATIAVLTQHAEPLTAAPGDPGEPSPGIAVYLEDFNNSQSDTPPEALANYSSSPPITNEPTQSPVVWSADAKWSDVAACNGWIARSSSVYQSGYCGNNETSFNKSVEVATQFNALLGGDAFGGALVYLTLTDLGTDNVVVKGSPKVKVDSDTGAFLQPTFDMMVYCSTSALPQLSMHMASGTGSSVQMAAPQSGCFRSDSIVTSTPSNNTKLAASRSKSKAVLVKDGNLTLEVRDSNLGAGGNNFLVDNIHVWDVTPTYHQVAESPVDFGDTATVRLVITNRYGPDGTGEMTDLAAKKGWSFTDILPAGLEFVGSPTTASGSEACTSVDVSGSNSRYMEVKGDLSEGQPYCVIEVKVKASEPGIYKNQTGEVLAVGLNVPTGFEVEFQAKPSIEITKTGEFLDLDEDGVPDLNEPTQFSFDVRNSGNVPLSNVAVTDPLAGEIVCLKTALAVAELTSCAPKDNYKITQANLDAGKVINQAVATAVSEYGSVSDKSDDPRNPLDVDPDGDGDPDDQTVLLLPNRPALTLDKNAATPTDVNGSGLTDSGDTIKYTFQVTNTGNVTVSSLAVADPSIGVVECPQTTIAVGSSVTCTAKTLYTVKDADETAGKVVNTAQASAKGPDGSVLKSNSDDTTIPISKPSPKLVLSKSAAAPVDTNASGIADAGDTIKFTFTVTNAGNVPIKSVKVNDPLAGTVTCSQTTLQPGVSTACTASSSYAVTATNETNGSVTNTATASGTDPDGATVKSNAATTTTAVTKPNPKLVLTKSAGAPVDKNSSGLADTGDTISYTFTVTNAGNVPLKSVAVTDGLAGAVTCTATTLAPGATTSCAASTPYAVTAANETAGEVRNTATASAKDPDGGSVTSNTAVAATPLKVPAPKLTIEKSVKTVTDKNSSGLTDAGDTISYSFVVTNLGNVPLSSVAVSDDKVTVTCPKTSLAVSEKMTCTSSAAYTVTETDEGAGSVKNVASASAKDPDGTAVTTSNDSAVVGTAAPAPKLTIEKSVKTVTDKNSSGLTDAGDTISYSFVVTNLGNVPLSSVVVTDDLVPVSCPKTSLAVSETMTCTSAPPPTPENPPCATLANGSLAVSDTASCSSTGPTVNADGEYVVTRYDESVGSVTNKATVSAKDPDNTALTVQSESVVVGATAPNPKLTIQKKVDELVDKNSSGLTDAGDTISYTFVLTNSGNVPLSSVTVSDDKVPVTCPKGLLAVSETMTCISGSTNPNDFRATCPTTADGSTGVFNTLDCRPPTATTAAEYVEPADARYVVTAADETAGFVRNVASTSARDPNGAAVTPASDDVTTGVSVAKPVLVLEKSAANPVDKNSSGLTDANDTIAYSFKVSNLGNVAVSSIAISDASLSNIACDKSTLNVGQTATCLSATPYTITEANESAGQVTNTATAAGKDPDGNAVTSLPDSVTTQVKVPEPKLTIDKSAQPPTDVNSSGIVDAGDTVEYRFSVTNTGDVPISNVAVSDAKAGAVTCTSTTLAVGAATTCAATSAYTITSADEEARILTNTATATGKDPDGVVVTSLGDTTSVPVALPAPALVLMKQAAPAVDTDSSGNADAGDTIQYSFTVRNAGNVPLTSLAISDPKAGTVTCEATSLAVDATTNCSADKVYTITATDQTAGAVVNRATASAKAPDSSTVESGQDTHNTPLVAPAPSVAIAKTANAPSDNNGNGLTDAGDTIQYVFEVSNTGNVPLSSLTVSDAKAGAVTCLSTTLAVDATTTCSADEAYTVTAADQTAKKVDNSATAAAKAPNGSSVTSAASAVSVPIDTPNPKLTLSKSADEPVDVNGSGIVDTGDTIRYRFTVTNAGNEPVGMVKITDAKAGMVTCTKVSLDVDETTDCVAASPYSITATDESNNAVVNSATASAKAASGATVTSPAAKATTAVSTQMARLALSKTAGTPVDENKSGLTDAGDTIRYTFKVSNSGNVPLTGVAVTDAKAGSVTCGDTSLAPGETASCWADTPYVITANDETVGKATNSATAAATDPDSDEVTSSAATTSTNVSTPSPSISLVKTADAAVDVNASGLVDAGDTIQYRFIVTNTGNVPVSAVSVSDPTAGAVTCEETTLAPDKATKCASVSPYRITSAEQAAKKVVNTAKASALDPDQAAVTSSTASVTTVVAVPTPSLTIVKTADTPVDVNNSGVVDAGDTIMYRFTVTNKGNVPINSVTVYDRLVGGVTCESTSLAPAAATKCVADAAYKITQGDELAGKVTNTAFADGRDPDGAVVSSTADAAETSVASPQPSLSVVKTAATPTDSNGSGIADAGDAIQYRFTVKNEGNVPLSSVSVIDPTAGSVNCTATVLAPSATTNCTAVKRYTVTEADEAAGAVVNRATARALDPDGVAVTSDESTVTVPLTTPNPALTISNIADNPVDANGSGVTDTNDTVQFRFKVTNTGNVPLTSISVADPLVGTVTCDATSLAVGAATTCAADKVYTITADDETNKKVVNTATASATDPDDGTVTSAPATATVPVQGAAPGLSLEKTAATPVDVNESGLVDAGDTIEYSFVVVNVGNVLLKSIAVTDPRLTAGVTCEATELQPEARTTCVAKSPYTVVAADEAAGAVDNGAIASGSDPNGKSATSPTAHSVVNATQPAPALTIVKTAGQPMDKNGSGLTDAGDLIQYAFVVTNSGNVPISSVAVSDDKVGAVTCTATELAVGASTNCAADASYTISADDVAAGSVKNSATASGKDPDGGAVASAPDTTETFTKTPNANLTLDKTAAAPVDVNNSGITDAGDTIAYSFKVTNTGNVPVSSIAVSDPAAGSATCSSTSLAPGEATNCTLDNPYTVTTDDEKSGLAENKATATGEDPDNGKVTSAPDSTVTPVSTPIATMDLEKQAGEPADANQSGVVDAGDTIAYRFVVSNNGNVPLSGLAVADATAGSVTCEATVVEPGEKVNCAADSPYVITADEVAAGSVRNSATASAKTPNGTTVSSPTAKTTTPVVRSVASLVISPISTSPVDVNESGLIDAGDAISYRFKVTNTGTVALSGVGVAATKIGDVTCTPTDLDVGQSATCVTDNDYVITKDDEKAGKVVVEAVAQADGAVGPTATSSTDQVDTPVMTPRPKLAFVKSAGPPVDRNGTGTFDAGDDIAYTFTVSNVGNIAVTGLSVDDSKLGTVKCAAPTLEVGESTTCKGRKPYSVSSSDVKAGRVLNTARAAGKIANGEAVVSNQSSSNTPVPSVVPLPDPNATPTTTTTLPRPTGDNLPQTGGDLLRTVGVGFACVVVGVLLVVAAWRRRGEHVTGWW